MRITEDVRRFAAEQKLTEDEALRAGLEQKAKEFVEKGAEVYAKTSSCSRLAYWQYQRSLPTEERKNLRRSLFSLHRNFAEPPGAISLPRAGQCRAADNDARSVLRCFRELFQP